jgi:HlyD family secretion protein
MTILLRRKGSVYIAILILAVVIALLLSDVRLQPSVARREPSLVPVTQGNLDISVKTVGDLDAARTHIVSSALKGDKGKIIYLVEEGAAVVKDDVLVRLDPAPFESEVHRLSGEVRSLEAARDAARQMLEWDKNQAEREIQTAHFEQTVAELELRRLIDGEGPLQLAQYRNELEKAKEEHGRYEAYIEDLKRLMAGGFDNPAELELSRRKAAQLAEVHQTAQQRYESYKDHVLPATLATARARADRAGADIEQVKKGATFKVARSMANLAEIEGKLEMAAASLGQATAELDKTIIRAPFGGIAILYEMFRDGQKRKPRVGDTVWQNQPLLYLPEIETMIVKTHVREVDLHKIAVNQNCAVQVDAYPERHFSGRVTAIGMLAAERFDGGAGEKYFQLTVTLEGENTLLRPGMTARVIVNSENVRDVLLLPIHAAFHEGSETYCYRVEKQGWFRKTRVRTGRYNEDQIEIVSGLRQGDLVSLLRPPPERITSDESEGDHSRDKMVTPK